MLQFEYLAPKSLIPYARNARKHSNEQISMLKGSIKEFGFTMPILVRDDLTLIAGHARLQAALEMGLDKVPVCKASHLTENQARALVHIDNQMALKSEWDFDALALELNDIDFNFEPYDFELPEVENVSKEGLTDDDDVPEVEQNIHGVVLGDIWKLGEHRIMCGDSTDVLHVEKLMNGEKADVVYTDPPYGMNLDTKRAEMKGTWSRNTRDYKPVAGDDKDFDPGFILGFFKDCAEIFLWGADYYAERLIDKNEGSWVVWDKRLTEELDAMWGSQFELCWSKNKHKREIARITWAGVCGHSKKDDGDLKVHPTMKPVKLHEWFFEKWFKNKNLVVDLFLGSGSTLIACEKTGRKCFGMELDPHYCSVIIERWQKFTGKKAERIQ